VGDFDADELDEHNRTCEDPDCPLCIFDAPLTEDEVGELERSGFVPNQLDSSEARAVLARIEIEEGGGLWLT
jgi:hypothetical protein